MGSPNELCALEKKVSLLFESLLKPSSVDDRSGAESARQRSRSRTKCYASSSRRSPDRDPSRPPPAEKLRPTPPKVPPPSHLLPVGEAQGAASGSLGRAWTATWGHSPAQLHEQPGCRPSNDQSQIPSGHSGPDFEYLHVGHARTQHEGVAREETCKVDQAPTRHSHDFRWGERTVHSPSLIRTHLADNEGFQPVSLIQKKFGVRPRWLKRNGFVIDWAQRCWEATCKVDPSGMLPSPLLIREHLEDVGPSLSLIEKTWGVGKRWLEANGFVIDKKTEGPELVREATPANTQGPENRPQLRIRYLRPVDEVVQENRRRSEDLTP
eukprot:gnl/TRDRNA2_/TRDRNA2_31108_c0_seq1.p1 gnl/TRDRNA2_/TRDRNA2_31108_c0~~gnl/TRDRNA2_/TRDRNA2_31108_c0_seq1.p1  ORF type:complete len:340 (-),score=29.62 gnl/TRDRNA2_/TRDRNA2_31108_c0_seq1:207-1178(-)